MFTYSRIAIWAGVVSALVVCLIFLSSMTSNPAPETNKLYPQIVHSKISSSVMQAARALQPDRQMRGEKLPPGITRARLDQAARIHVYIYVSEIAPEIVEALLSQDVEIELVSHALQVLQAWIPATKLEQIAEQDFVQSVRLPDYAMRLTGSVTTEGDTLLQARDIRLENSVRGSGVRVGVISDGIDSRADAQNTDDLPVAIEIDPDLPGSGDEGTAMLEIIHDLAPESELAFSGVSTGAEMLDAIRYLANDAFNGLGCQIIVDDLGFLGEPFFEDGAIAATVEQVVSQGHTYVTAAGNQARTHYENQYFPGALRINGFDRTVHDFGLAAGQTSDVGQSVVVQPGTRVTVVLQWNDRYRNPQNDYDLLLMDENLNNVLSISEDTQDGGDGQLAIEFATFENNSSRSARINVVVRNLNAASRLLEIHYAGDNFSLEEFNVPEGSIIPGQQSAVGAITVGAINVSDPGADDIEAFSSRGPVRHFFPTEERRLKPDIVAVDGNVITGAGGFGQRIGDAVRFFGTSAAAPHVAGIAALLLSGEPQLSTGDVRAAMEVTAVDLGAPGADNIYGAGRINAKSAFLVAVAGGDIPTPTTFQLFQNHPNPPDPDTQITFAITEPVNERAILTVYNVLGQKVVTLLDEPLPAGQVHSIRWDGTNSQGQRVPSGVYFYRLRLGNSEQTMKMFLVR